MKKLKTKEQLLADFKKANKVRRITLANRAGFDTPDEYKEHLIFQIEKEDKDIKKEQLTVHNVHILDCSASMTWYSGTSHTKFQTAKQGITKEVNSLSGSKDINYLQTLVTFSSSDQYKIECFKQKIGDFIFPTRVCHYGTALYDAIERTLSKVIKEREPNEKTIIKIFTDGDNNEMYNKFNPAKELIKQCESLDITVTFVGTEQDVKNIISHLKIDESNTLSHDNTSESIEKVFDSSIQATRSYSTKALAGEDTLVGFYKQSGTL